MVETFIFYSRTWKAAIKRLSLEQRGSLLTAIINSSLGEEEPELDPAVAIAFDILLSRIQEDKNKYEETCEKRRSAGKKGGQAKAQNVANVANASFASIAKQEEASLANVANASFAKQEIFCNPDNDNDHDNDHENDNDHDNNHDNENDPSTEGIEIDLSSSLPAGQARPVKNAILRQEDFEQWYLAYPRHEGKQCAIKAWNKAIKENALPETNILLASLEWQKNLAQWQDKQFIPLPASYLNGRRWQDEKPAPYVAPTFQQGQKAPVYDPNRTWTGEEMLAYYTNLEREFNEEMAQKNAQKEQAASAAIGE